MFLAPGFDGISTNNNSWIYLVSTWPKIDFRMGLAVCPSSADLASIELSGSLWINVSINVLADIAKEKLNDDIDELHEHVYETFEHINTAKETAREILADKGKVTRKTYGHRLVGAWSRSRFPFGQPDTIVRRCETCDTNISEDGTWTRGSMHSTFRCTRHKRTHASLVVIDGFAAPRIRGR